MTLSKLQDQQVARYEHHIAKLVNTRRRTIVRLLLADETLRKEDLEEMDLIEILTLEVTLMRKGISVT